MSRTIGSPTWEPDGFDFDEYIREAERPSGDRPWHVKNWPKLREDWERSQLELEPCGYDGCESTENLCEWCGECPKHCQLECIEAIEALHQGGGRE